MDDVTTRPVVRTLAWALYERRSGQAAGRWCFVDIVRQEDAAEWWGNSGVGREARPLYECPRRALAEALARDRYNGPETWDPEHRAAHKCLVQDEVEILARIGFPEDPEAAK